MKGDQYIRGQHLLGSQYQTYLVDHTLHKINSINFELIDKPLYIWRDKLNDDVTIMTSYETLTVLKWTST